jgi:hypothetical protein
MAWCGFRRCLDYSAEIIHPFSCWDVLKTAFALFGTEGLAGLDTGKKDSIIMNAGRAVIFALCFNIIVLVPVVTALMVFPVPAEHGFGPLTSGRLILTSIYISIALVSGALIVMHRQRLNWAMPMSVALFAVQITYKLITVPLVGLGNPVVITNLLVVVVQSFALWLLWQSRSKSLA